MLLDRVTFEDDCEKGSFPVDDFVAAVAEVVALAVRPGMGRCTLDGGPTELTGAGWMSARHSK